MNRIDRIRRHPHSRRRRFIAVFFSLGGELEERALSSISPCLARLLELPLDGGEVLISPDDGEKLAVSRADFDEARLVIDSTPLVFAAPTHISRLDPSSRRFKVVRFDDAGECRVAVIGKVVFSNDSDHLPREIRIVTAFRIRKRWLAKQVREGGLVAPEGDNDTQSRAS